MWALYIELRERYQARSECLTGSVEDPAGSAKTGARTHQVSLPRCTVELAPPYADTCVKYGFGKKSWKQLFRLDSCPHCRPPKNYPTVGDLPAIFIPPPSHTSSAPNAAREKWTPAGARVSVCRPLPFVQTRRLVQHVYWIATSVRDLPVTERKLCCAVFELSPI